LGRSAYSVHVVEPFERTLVVMRHAKAQSYGPTDFERELAPRGLRDAGEAGSWLAAAGLRADHALVSAAVRTRQTWERVSGAADWAVEPDLDRGLYAAGPETALDLIRLTPEEATTLVVVGHNPTMGSLAYLLDDGEGDTAATGAIASGTFPTCALAVFAVSGPWSGLTTGGARLRALRRPDGG